MTRGVGIVLPAYEPDVDTLSTYVAELDQQLDPETIRIELDGASTETISTLASTPATVNAVSNRRGKGAAITAGFDALATDDALNAETFVYTDADGSTPVESVSNVIESVRRDEIDLAVGSRRHPEASVQRHQSVGRRRLGDVFAWIARRFLAVSLYDYQCGTKAIGSDTWRAVREYLCEPGFAWDVELVAITGALGHEVAEVPITWVDDPHSTVSPVGTAVELGRALFAIRHRTKRLAGSPLHTAIANRRPAPVTVIERSYRDSNVSPPNE